MKVLIADTFERGGVEALASVGCDVVYRPGLKGDALAEVLHDTASNVLVVRSTLVTASILDAGPLLLVVRAGAGYNTIDVAAASSRGIYVSNCPGRNAVAVAELAFGLILALDRRIPDNVADLRSARWNKKEYSKARGLFGRRLGLLGYGSVGREMAARALAFGMEVTAWSRSLAAANAAGPVTIGRSPQEVAEQCDVLSLHLALAPETRRLVDASVLERLKPGSYFINTARAELVDEVALARAVGERNIRVALDVFASEPEGATGVFDDPLIKLANVYGTHHIGASTDQAQAAIADETVRIIATYKCTGQVPNAVNLATRTKATYRLVVRHRDRPGVLAHVFDHLRSDNVNVQETENVVFDGAHAAVACLNLDVRPSDALLKTIREGSGDVLDVQLVAI